MTNDYDLIDRVWRDVSSNSADSVFVEIFDGLLTVTVLTDDDSLAVQLSKERVVDLRNALNRALRRLP